MATREQVLKALEKVDDPELKLNIVDLGLVYEVEASDDAVYVKMTLTAPGCPVAGYIVDQCKERIREATGIEDPSVELVWEPRWTQDRMSERLKKAMRMGILKF